MKTLMIILTAFACLTSSGCDEEFIDPAWGDWEARNGSCDANTQFEIDDDYRGDGRFVTSECKVCQVNLEIELVDDGEYEIEADAVDCSGSLDLDCELDDDELECEDRGGTRIDFERD